MQIIEVDEYTNVVASVFKKKKKILISSRPRGKKFPGLYEFPGGKLNTGEYLIEALAREIKEELGVKIDLNKVYFLKSYKIIQKSKKINLHFFLCLKWSGDPVGLEEQTLKWIFPHELKNHNLLKSNLKFTNYLLRNIFPTTN
tara:strand:- start:442 stop:870 length:429 start_codon:yes stop_codon:yes gene_type:complete